MGSHGVQLAHAMPDFPTNTIFIAVCGPSVEACGPDSDGWFFSDFYLMYEMFRGLGASRCFWTTVEPDALLKKHNGYLLHGNPRLERKVVLSLEMTAGLDDLKVHDNPAEFYDDFLSALAKVCSDAGKTKQPVFLMLFGHGDPETSGVIVGRKSSRKILPKFRISDARKLCEKNPSLQLSIMTTSCFAGPWAKIIDATVMTASNKEESLSWAQSGSLRFNGSPFTSAFTSVLATTSPDGENDEEDIKFGDFTAMIQSRLSDLTSSFGHDFTFNAANGKWDENYRPLTGTPRGAYKQRLEALNTHAASGTKEDPTVGLGALNFMDDGRLSAWDRITVRTGSVRGAQAALREMSTDYLAGKPGAKPADYAVNSAAEKCVRGEVLDKEEEATLWSSLSYRKRVEATTASLLYLLDLAPFPALRDWEREEWLQGQGLGPHEFNSSFMTVFNKVMPKPAGDEGLYWSKPAYYLAAACMKKGLTMQRVDERAERVRKFVKKATLKATDILMGLESGTRGRNDSKLMTLGRTIRARIRSKSPREHERPSLVDAGLRG